MGARDARRWLRADPGPDDPWQIEPLDAFTRQSVSNGNGTPSPPRPRAGRR